MKKHILLSISILLLVLAITLRFTYIPYIHDNSIFDYYIADTIVHFLFVPIYVSLYYGFSKKPRELRFVVLYTVIGYVLYRILSHIGLHELFWHEFVAIVLGGIVTYLALMKTVKTMSVD